MNNFVDKKFSFGIFIVVTSLFDNYDRLLFNQSSSGQKLVSFKIINRFISDFN